MYLLIVKFKDGDDVFMKFKTKTDAILNYRGFNEKSIKSLISKRIEKDGYIIKSYFKKGRNYKY